MHVRLVIKENYLSLIGSHEDHTRGALWRLLYIL
jgi:hypothetical protein